MNILGGNNIGINANILGAKGRKLPLPVQLGSVLYLSKTNGRFDTSESGSDTYINEWIDPYTGKKATQTTGDYRPRLVDNGVEFDGTDDNLVDSSFNLGQTDWSFCIMVKSGNTSG